MHERLEVIVRGRVQLVMYRDFVQRNASNLKLTGRVRNMSDGTVRVIAEGPQEVLQRLLKKLERGSLLSNVTSVEPVWSKAINAFSDFKIDYDRI